MLITCVKVSPGSLPLALASPWKASLLNFTHQPLPPLKVMDQEEENTAVLGPRVKQTTGGDMNGVKPGD